MNTITASECVKFGWEVFKKRPWFILGAMIIMWIVTNAPSYLFGPEESAPMSGYAFLFTVAIVALGLAVEIVMTRFWLKAHDTVESMKYEDAFPPRPFWKYVGAKIATAIVIIIGLILLIVPGIIAMLMFVFTPYLVVERKMWPIEAMKESARITKGHRMNLFVLMLMLLGLNIVGALFLLIGLLVTIPISMLAVAHAYRTLEHKANEVAPAAASAA